MVFWAFLPFLSKARPLAGPAALLLIVIGFFWKLVLTDQYSWLESPDLANQVVPWFQFQAQQFHLHKFPAWDPFLFAGQSLIGQAQPGLAYPLNWILFSLPLDNGHISFTALNWYFLSIHYLAALFCYFLCLDLGRGIIASVLAGLAFGLGGYIGTTDWPQMINGAVWAPLVFLFLFRVARGVRPVASGAFSGLFLGMSWLSGHHQVPIFVTLAAGVVWLYFLLERGRFRWALIAPLGVFLAFVLLTSALQTWPAYSYGNTAVRWVGANEPVHWNEAVPYTVHQQYSLSPIYLLGIVIPGYLANVSPFAGIVALTLAGLALACWWKTKEVRIFFALGIAGLLLALARNDVLHGILYSIVPLFEKARSPAVALCLFHFAIAVLIAFGVDALFVPSMKATVRRGAWLLAGFGAVTLIVCFAVKLGRALIWSFDDRVMMTTLAAFALAGILYRVGRMTAEMAGYGFLALIGGLYLVEIGNVSLYALANKEEKDRRVYLKNYAATEAVAKFLRKQPGPIRVDVNDADVPFNFGDWYGIDTVSGYAASLPEAFNELEAHTPRAKMLLGANYALSKKPTMEGQEEVFRDDNGLIVFKNPNVLPRVWVVHEAVRIKDAKEARRNLQDPGFDLGKKTFGYAAPPALERCDGDVVRSFERDVEATTAIVDMNCRGMVVMSESDAPGWKALVDGKPVPIYDAYTMLRGVVVGPGTHKIETRYRPLSVTAGALATLSAFLGALALWIIGRGENR
jgi:hypothetical protein